jgi:hypothetical protein
MSRRRVRAIFHKELREYRHNGNIVYAMVILPVVFLIQPLIQIFTLPSSASVTLHHEHSLVYMLAIPALVPAALASYAVVGERLQGTLEPVLATPIRREELLLGKALAAFVPALAVSYAVYALFIAVVELFAHPGVASALIRPPDLLAQLLFTPLLAAWSIWLGSGHHAHRLQCHPADPCRGSRLRGRPADPRPPRLADRLGHFRPRTTHHRHQVTMGRACAPRNCMMTPERGLDPVRGFV